MMKNELLHFHIENTNERGGAGRPTNIADAREHVQCYKICPISLLLLLLHVFFLEYQDQAEKNVSEPFIITGNETGLSDCPKSMNIFSIF